MPETPTASDLEKAHLILREFGLLIGPGGAVAAGIALGRKDALAAARLDTGKRRRVERDAPENCESHADQSAGGAQFSR
jgi:hypothetical protein